MNNLLNNETKRLCTIIIIITAGILFFILYGSHNGKKILSDVEELLKSNTPKLIYIIRDGCKYCELNKSNIELMEKEYNLEYYKVDIDKLNDNELTKLYELLNIDRSNFGTPYMQVVQNGKSIENFSGLSSYKLLFDFLKRNNIINSSSSLKLNYPDLEEYNELIESSTKEAIVLATSYCQYCLKEHPILVDIANKYNVKINYVYLDYMFKSQEEYNSFLTSLNWYSANEDWGTPTMLIVKNKEVIKSLQNYRSEADIIEFLKDNDIIR